jgi:hypothetical protein
MAKYRPREWYDQFIAPAGSGLLVGALEGGTVLGTLWWLNAYPQHANALIAVLLLLIYWRMPRRR